LVYGIIPDAALTIKISDKYTGYDFVLYILSVCQAHPIDPVHKEGTDRKSLGQFRLQQYTGASLKRKICTIFC